MIPSAADYDKRSSCSMLESETVYLPADGRSPVTPARPMTAPLFTAVTSPATHSILENLTRENRPATAIGYDARPIKPMNPDLYKGMYKQPDFKVSPPQMSGNEPVLGIKKQVPPTAQAVDCDTSQDASIIDDLPKENVENIPVAELSLIRDAVLRKVKTKTLSASNRPKADDPRLKVVEKNKKDRHDSVHMNVGSKTSIPVASKSTVSRTHSEYIPGKYSTARRPVTSESERTKTKPLKSHNHDFPNKIGAKCEPDASFHDSGIYSRPNSDAVLFEGL